MLFVPIYCSCSCGTLRARSALERAWCHTTIAMPALLFLCTTSPNGRPLTVCPVGSKNATGTTSVETFRAFWSGTSAIFTIRLWSERVLRSSLQIFTGCRCSRRRLRRTATATTLSRFFWRWRTSWSVAARGCEFRETVAICTAADQQCICPRMLRQDREVKKTFVDVLSDFDISN